MVQKEFTTKSVESTKELGKVFGKNLKGGEVLELLSDLGGGKTTFVSGVVDGFGSSDPVASPTFTISNVYTRTDKKEFHHFDFYRLEEAGIIKNELVEDLGEPDLVVAVEWGEVVHDVLPEDRIKILIKAVSENERTILFSYPSSFSYLFAGVKDNVS